MKISCVIPCRDPSDELLQDLIKTIKAQDYPQEDIEIIISTQGDSEEAKARGVRQSTGDIIAFFCADNLITNKNLFSCVVGIFRKDSTLTGVYTRHYAHMPKGDYSLNRYFALMGVNDPVPWFLGKADRLPYTEHKDDVLFEKMWFKNGIPSLGDNGFFYRKDVLMKSDLDHYYPMDNAEDLRKLGHYNYMRMNLNFLLHRTADNNLIGFLLRRYRYARNLYCDRKDRRWKVVGGTKDYIGLVGFVFYSLTFVLPIATAIRGFIKRRDFAWFWHPFVCFGFTIMYGALTCRNALKSLLSFLRLGGKKNS